MSILNKDFIRENICSNQSTRVDDRGAEYTKISQVPYRWTHGANDYHMGDGLLIYSFVQYMRAKVCVCLGSGGGFIPRIMTQARLDLHDEMIFDGDNHPSWGDIGATYVVDAANGVGGYTDWTSEDSFFRRKFQPRIILDTTENAFYNFFVKEDIKIDYLHIDADHSYEGVKQDFQLYSKLVAPHGLISIHDTDGKYEENYIVTKDIADQSDHDEFTSGPAQLVSEISDDWEKFSFFNEGILPEKPSSTGFTLLRRKNAGKKL